MGMPGRLFATVWIDFSYPNQDSYRAVELRFDNPQRNCRFATGDPARDHFMALVCANAANIQLIHFNSNVADFVDCGETYYLENRDGDEVIARREAK